MIFEEMLTYASYSNLFETSIARREAPPDQASVRLAAAMDADTVRFFLRMTADISVLAAYIRRPLYRSAVPGSLGTALTAAPADRSRAWRRVYVQSSCLLARCVEDASPETFHGALANAFARLQKFVSENADLVRA
jgi:hypothetical protein